MVICHSGKSAISANLIADQDDTILTNRGADGDINWGRYKARTRLNPDIGKVTNKRIMRELFQQNEVPYPRLFNVKDILLYEYGMSDDPEDEAGHISWPIVGRPDQHSKGRGFWLCHTHDDIKRALRGTSKKKAATHFMEYINAPREYRVHIFLGKSIRISQKSFDESGDRHDYTTIKPGEFNVKHVRKAAKKAMKAVGLDFGAVDILANDTECWVLEVNAAPGLGGSMPRLYAEVFNKWMRGEW